MIKGATKVVKNRKIHTAVLKKLINKLSRSDLSIPQEIFFVEIVSLAGTQRCFDIHLTLFGSYDH